MEKFIIEVRKGLLSGAIFLALIFAAFNFDVLINPENIENHLFYIFKSSLIFFMAFSSLLVILLGTSLKNVFVYVFLIVALSCVVSSMLWKPQILSYESGKVDIFYFWCGIIFLASMLFESFFRNSKQVDKLKEIHGN